jgi:Spx/MgsR family transcriptional regulator
MSVKVYHYPKCSTCRNAIKWLKANGTEVDLVDLVETPPSREDLAQLIRASGLEVKKFFNVSGQVYKQMQLKDKVATMSEQEMIDLLASNGKLIKRPIVSRGNQVTVGFKEDEFQRTWAD